MAAEGKTTVVERIPLGFRIGHWFSIFLMLLLVITGWEIHYGTGMLRASVGSLRTFHVFIGAAWLATAIVWGIYYWAVSGEWKEHFKGLFKYDLKEFWYYATRYADWLGAFFKPEEFRGPYAVYNPEKGDYERKGNLFLKIDVLLWVVLVLFAGYTGIILAFNGHPTLGGLVQAMQLGGLISYQLARNVHYALLIFIVEGLMWHLAFWNHIGMGKYFRAMVRGKAPEWTVFEPVEPQEEKAPSGARTLWSINTWIILLVPLAYVVLKWAGIVNLDAVFPGGIALIMFIVGFWVLLCALAGLTYKEEWGVV